MLTASLKFLLLLVPSCVCAQPPDYLRVESRVAPIGVDIRRPRLTWNLGGAGMQRAYQIRAGEWDSGKVESPVAAAIYDGPPLQSRQRVAWQVRVWTAPDAAQPGEWSAPAAWEMGLLERAAWTAQWIASPNWTESQPLPLFARQFSLSRTPVSARLYIAGLGVYRATLNGRAVSSEVLAPGNTNFARQVEYESLDVTSLLLSGANTLAVALGNGAFNALPTPGRYMKFVNPAAAPPRLLAQLELSYAGGTRESIATDSTWKTAPGPTTTSTWFGGEDFDARREQPGWDLPGADLSSWQPAAISQPPAPVTELAWRAAPGIQVVDRLDPVDVTQPQPGIYVFDMGVNFAGWPQLRASGPAGTRIALRIGELLSEAGTVRQDTTGFPIFDTYTLAGRGVETWHPQFLYHGFRYLEVSGLPSAPAPGDISGVVLRAANETAGAFSTTDPLLTGIHRIVGRAIQSNMMSIFTDCPDREKLGWLADMQGIFPSIARNFDVAAYMRTIVRNMAEAQTADGLVPDFVPEYTVYSGGFRDDPNWGNAMILAPWSVYETYGDPRLIEDYYPAMQRYLAYLSSRSSGNLLNYGLGDWITPDPSVPTGVIASYGYYRAADAMSRAAAAIGRTAESAAYAALAADIAAAFNAKYLDRGNHTYASGQHAADAVALDMGIVPAEERPLVEEHLVAAIRAGGNHANVGIVALPALFRALSAAGRDDVILDIALQTTSPSYGYQLMHGATSLTEEWDGPTKGASQNHMMLGAIDEWFTAGLAGIRQAPGSAGFRELSIRPAILPGITAAAGSYRTPNGLVESAWTRGRGGSFRLSVTIPPNTTATVYVPDPGSGTAAFKIYSCGPGKFTFRGGLRPVRR